MPQSTKHSWQKWGPVDYKTTAMSAISLIVAITLWEIAAWLVDSPYFPGFSDVVNAFATIAIKGDVEGYSLLDHAVASVLRVLAGFSVACLTGIPQGLLMGLKPSVYKTSKSIIEPLRFIPPIAWIPLAFILLRGYSRYVFLIWLGAFFPIFLNVMASVKRTSPTLVDVAKTFGANKKQTILKIVVPSALPEIVAGMRIGLGVGWMCIVAAEMIPLPGGATTGLGRLIWNYTELQQVDVIIVGMITIGLLGLLMNEILLQTEKRLFRWRPEVKL